MRTVDLPSVINVVAGATAILNIPMGPTYHDIIFTRGGTSFTNTHIDEIRFIVNGTEKFKCSGVELDALNQQQLGSAATATLTHLSFDMLGTRSLATKRLTAFRTGPVVRDGKLLQQGPGSARIEIDIAAGASAPTLSARARIGVAQEVSSMIIRRKFTESPSAIGVYQISDIPKVAPIRQIAFKHSNITEFEILLDQVSIVKRTIAENDFLSQLTGHRVSQSGYLVFSPGEEGDGGAVINTANIADFRIKLTMSGADTVDYFVDYVAAPISAV